MIVVDTSIWIAWLRAGREGLTAETWHDIDPLDIVVGDIVLLELLRGARNDADADRIGRILDVFHFERMLDHEVAVEAARHYRHLRSLGITVRKAADLIIGTFCIRHGHALLQRDRDFLPMAEHCGLRLV